MLTLCQMGKVLGPTQTCWGYVNCTPQNAKCIWAVPDVVSKVPPIKRGMRSTLKSRKTLQDWLKNSAACNRGDGASMQFWIEHITCQPNLTKFSQKRSVENAFSKPAVNFLQSNITFNLSWENVVLLFEHFPFFVWICWKSNRNVKLQCLEKQHQTKYWKMPFHRISSALSRIYYLSI